VKLFELEEHLRLGGTVRRKAWDQKEQGLRMTEYWSIRVESLFATDWEPEGVTVVEWKNVDGTYPKQRLGVRPATLWELYKDDEGEEHA
jgi:hypothetical protein